MIAVTSTVFKGGEEKYFNANTLGSAVGNTSGRIQGDVFYNSPNIGMVAAYQGLYDKHKDEDLIVFMHDDVEILDPTWHLLVKQVFKEDLRLAILGFGGATGLGVDDIYKTPYHISQLQRIDYYSNQVGWEIHGKRETGVRDVAVVDGFLMAVRTDFLKQIDGWKTFGHNFHMYDVWLCLKAIECGWKVKMVGLECDHHGGATSTSAEYMQYCRDNGTTPEREHWEPHVTVYNGFRHLLPLRIY